MWNRPGSFSFDKPAATTLLGNHRKVIWIPEAEQLKYDHIHDMATVDNFKTLPRHIMLQLAAIHDCVATFVQVD